MNCRHMCMCMCCLDDDNYVPEHVVSHITGVLGSDVLG